MVTSAYGDMIQTGVTYNGYLQDKGSWNLHIAQPPGERNFKYHINYPQEFTEGLPVVLVMLSGIDADKATNQRFLVATNNITQYGFNVLYKAWGDTRVYSAWTTWIAIPRSMVYTPQKTTTSTLNATNAIQKVVVVKR
jgi:hypothetical protein